MLLMLFGKVWEASMETEGPVAHAVLGCVCWFSPCLLETALASSFVYSRWCESSILVNIAALHIPFCLTSCASDRFEFSAAECHGSNDFVLALRAVGRCGQVFRFSDGEKWLKNS